jgi:meiotic recombination protein DMC1
MKTKPKAATKVLEKENNVHAVNEEESEEFFSEIDRLEEMGINVADIAKLKAAGFCTTSSVSMVMKKELENIKGMTTLKIEKIQEAAKKLEKFGFMSGTEL